MIKIYKIGINDFLHLNDNIIMLIAPCEDSVNTLLIPIYVGLLYVRGGYLN